MKRISAVISSIKHTTSFILLLVVYLTSVTVNKISKGRTPKFFKILYSKALKLFDGDHVSSISRVDLIELSIKNMATKRTRTLVTIGGMALGIGTIVFLVSIGYGLQQMVIMRVAHLGEMRQTEVSPQTGGKVVINDKTLTEFKDIPGVAKVLPLISVVGQVTYQNSVSDMAVYGVTTEYLNESAIKPIHGRFFENNELALENADLPGRVAGDDIERVAGGPGEVIGNVSGSINSGSWLKVRDNPSTDGKILGWTKRVEGEIKGEEVWGGQYISDGKDQEKWIKSEFLLWKEGACDTAVNGDCENGKYQVLRDTDNSQAKESGFIAEINLTLADNPSDQSPLVLGESTSLPTGWVEIASESGVAQAPETQMMTLGGSKKKEAVVNVALLRVLGINEAEAIGKEFSSSFVVVGELLADNGKKVQSLPATYTIVGVTPEDKTPVFYVPFVDLRSLGITQFSQTKVVVQDQGLLTKARRQIEAMGFVTRSVADTVAQINSLFGTARLILALLGVVALAVAALGMFNTLTVSLLERTREVGLMKAMGMKSAEVQELFLTESMIMGFVGGLVGILLGFVCGKFVGLILSVFSIFRGSGYIDIAYLPWPFLLLVIFLSLLVGIATGIFPAKRATKISALNALRYE